AGNHGIIPLMLVGLGVWRLPPALFGFPVQLKSNVGIGITAFKAATVQVETMCRSRRDRAARMSMCGETTTGRGDQWSPLRSRSLHEVSAADIRIVRLSECRRCNESSERHSGHELHEKSPCWSDIVATSATGLNSEPGKLRDRHCSFRRAIAQISFGARQNDSS